MEEMNKEKQQTFTEYITGARDRMVREVNIQNWNTRMGTEIEAFLIAYDQLRNSRVSLYIEFETASTEYAEKLKQAEKDNETLEAELEGAENDLKEAENERHEFYIELEEYKDIKLISADDRMRWDKMKELFPKLTWDTLKKIEDGKI